MALIKAKEKQPNLMSFIVDSGKWFPWQLTWEVRELEELRTPIGHHPQLIKGFLTHSAYGTGTVSNGMMGEVGEASWRSKPIKCQLSSSETKHSGGTVSLTFKSIRVNQI